MLWDSAGIVRYVNPAGLRLLGRTENSATNLTTTDLFAPGTTSTVEDAERAAREPAVAWTPRTPTHRYRCHGSCGVVILRLNGSGRRTDTRASPPPRLDAELVDVDAAAHRLTIGQSARAGLARLGVSADLDAVLAATTTTAATLLGVRSAAVARRGAPTDPVLRIDAVTRTLRTDVVVPADDGSLSGHALAHVS